MITSFERQSVVHQFPVTGTLASQSTVLLQFFVARILTTWRLSAKGKRESWDNTKAHFSVAGNARTAEFNEWFWRLQDVESNHSGRLFHVSSQPVMIPSSRSLLSRDKRLPLDTWNQFRLQENVVGNQFSTFDSPRDYHSICRRAKNREAVPEAERTKTIHISDDTFATKPLTTSSTMLVELQQNYVVGQQRQQISELQFYKCPNPQSVTTCSDFPSDARLWINEVEVVDSFFLEQDFPNLEMLDAKIACAPNKIIQKSQFKKKVFLEEQKAPKEDLLLRGRQIAFMIYVYFRVTGFHDAVLDYTDLFSVTLHDDNIQEFDTRWNEVLLSMSKIPSHDILESLYKLRIRESDQLKTVLELYDLENHQKISVPIYQKLKTMVKRSTVQKLRLRNFDARHGRIESGTVVKSRKGLVGFEGGKGTCYQWKEKGQCFQGDRCSFLHETQDCAQKPEHTAATPSEPTVSRGWSVSRKRSIRGEGNHGSILRQPCRYHLKGTCTRTPCEYWHAPECQFCKSENGLYGWRQVSVSALQGTTT